jgi:hypothetical protein
MGKGSAMSSAQPQVKIKYTLIFKRSARGFGTAFKEGKKKIFTGIGKLWHKTMLPKHFDIAAIMMYKYERRSKSHIAKKKRLFGHNKPLRYTGEMQEKLQARADIKASSNRVKVKMTGPSHMKFRPKKLIKHRKNKKSFTTTGKGPDKIKEITTVAKGEEKEFVNVAKKRFKRIINQSRDNRKVS